MTGSIGRYASKVLAEFGADVVRIVAAEPGPDLGQVDPSGLLEWWYDTNCTVVPLDLTRPEDVQSFRRLLAEAEILIEDRAPGSLDELGFGLASIREINPRLVQVSLSPYGSSGPRSHWRTSDLVAQAQGTYLSVTGDPDHPVPLYGRQSSVIGGLYAAVSALAGLHRARRSGEGSWVDLSLHEAIISCSEHVLMFWWFAEALAPFGAPIPGRQRSLHWIRAFEVVPCLRGACMVSPAAGGLLALIAWLKERGYAEDVPAEPAAEDTVGLIPVLMDALRAAAADHDATELFEAGQSLHVPFGEAYSVAQVAACPQHEFRGFLRPVSDRPGISIPGPLAHFTTTPAPPPLAPETVIGVDDVLARWRTLGSGAEARQPSESDGAGGDRTEPASAAGSDGPLSGLRVLDFTHVLAGPFATRIFGDLGADVIRVQTDERQAGTGANEYPYNVMWGRNKRSIQLAMKHERALSVVAALVAEADVVIDNFSAGVMASWGAGPEQLAEWNPALITMSMSGCGTEGPWSSFVTYAPTVHALCGLTALSGPEGDSGCGPGVAYNDHISGLVAATALLAALAERASSGRGQHIDLSQLEVGTSLIGPALVDYVATGQEATATGTRDPFADHLINDVFACADDELVAVTVPSTDDWNRLGSVVDLGPGDDPRSILSGWSSRNEARIVMERLQEAGIAAGIVATADHLFNHDPQLAHRDWLRTVESELVGEQHIDRHPGRWYDGDTGRELELQYRATAYLGQHNFEVYPEILGWDEGQVAEALGDDLLL